MQLLRILAVFGVAASLSACSSGPASTPNATVTVTQAASPTSAPPSIDPQYQGAAVPCGKVAALEVRLNLLIKGVKSQEDIVFYLQNMAREFQSIAAGTSVAFGQGSNQVGELATQVATDANDASSAVLGLIGGVSSKERAASLVTLAKSDMKALDDFCKAAKAQT